MIGYLVKDDISHDNISIHHNFERKSVGKRHEELSRWSYTFFKGKHPHFTLTGDRQRILTGIQSKLHTAPVKITYRASQNYLPVSRKFTYRYVTLLTFCPSSDS